MTAPKDTAGPKGWDGKDRRTGSDPDPWDRLGGLIRSTVEEVLDERLADADDDDDDDYEEGDDGGNAGTPAVGGTGRTNPRTGPKAGKEKAQGQANPGPSGGSFFDFLTGSSKPKG